jgi:hypothetical protein
MIMVVRMLPAAWGLRATPSQAETAAGGRDGKGDVGGELALEEALGGGGGGALREGDGGQGEQEGGGEELLHGGAPGGCPRGSESRRRVESCSSAENEAFCAGINARD